MLALLNIVSSMIFLFAITRDHVSYIRDSSHFNHLTYVLSHFTLVNMNVSLDFLVGFALALVSQLLLAAVAQFYTRAHRTIKSRDSADPRKGRRYVWEPYWLLGFTCTMIGFTSDVLSLGYAPASLIAPLNSLKLVLNMCLSPIVNGEQVSRRTIISTLIICSGTVISVLFSPRGNQDEGTDIGEELKNIYISRTFALFSTFMMLLAFSLWAITIRWKDNLKVYSLAIPALSGILSAMNRTVSKGVAIGWKFTFRGDGVCFTEWLWYLVCIAMSFFSFGYLKWLNRGLIAFSPLQILPVNLVFGVLGTTTAGLLVFHEWDQFTGLHAQILFSIGIMILIAGVFPLRGSPGREVEEVPKPASRSDQENESIISDEKVIGRNSRERSLD